MQVHPRSLVGRRHAGIAGPQADRGQRGENSPPREDRGARRSTAADLSPVDAAVLWLVMCDGTIQRRGATCASASTSRSPPASQRSANASPAQPSSSTRPAECDDAHLPRINTWSASRSTRSWLTQEAPRGLMARADRGPADLPRLAAHLSGKSRRAMLNAMMAADGAEVLRQSASPASWTRGRSLRPRRHRAGQARNVERGRIQQQMLPTAHVALEPFPCARRRRGGVVPDETAHGSCVRRPHLHHGQHEGEAARDAAVPRSSGS